MLKTKKIINLMIKAVIEQKMINRINQIITRILNILDLRMKIRVLNNKKI